MAASPPRLAAALAAGVIIALGATAVLATRTHGSPEQTATAFLSAWEKGDLGAMRAQVVDAPRSFEQINTAFTKEAQIRRITVGEIGLRAKQHLNVGEAATYFATFPVTLDGPVPYSYQGEFEIIEFDGAWKVNWSPTAIHPELQEVGSSEVRTVRVVREPDGAPRLVLLEKREVGEQAGALFASEGMKLVSTLAEREGTG
ncbi:NTF2-like N-terminal transpeptidase domain-containing protein [Nonomuraea sp. NPDC050663]|uniref:NTF2-like N-terminal transpeptidase domain-containing protein n=1 Tax=Nonomuraea sp. NPDC050663 TaxID=3364370 RepID=UPI0037A3A082